MESDDVGILQIVYSSSGVSLLTYVLVDAVTVLDGDTLLLAIQVHIHTCEF